MALNLQVNTARVKHSQNVPRSMIGMATRSQASCLRQTNFTVFHNHSITQVAGSLHHNPWKRNDFLRSVSFPPRITPLSHKSFDKNFKNGSITSMAVGTETTNLALSISKRKAMSEKDTFSKSSGYIATASGVEIDKWIAYDAEAIAKYYKKKPFLLARRLIQIGISLGSWLGKRWIDEKLGKGDENFKERAAELRSTLVELGPAFVKIAQAVSSRPDVVPGEYLDELSLLQDRIAPFSTAMALDIIEEELGVPVESIFSEISPKPVAAASLGQVYEARLRPNGQAVAVKVQRPGVKAAIALDVYILRILAGWLRDARKLNTDLQGVVDEWAASLFKEMNYQAEAQNGIRFRKLFGDLPDVLVPRMFPELTSERVLVMEWVEGQRLSEVSDLKLVEVGVYCSLTQLLDSGFYHADPHPGNLLKTPDGKLAYLDFGMMGEMSQNLREALITACVHLVNREFDALATDFVSLGLIPANQEMGAVTEALTDVFQNAISQGVRNVKFGDMSVNLGKTMYNFKFRLPSYFSLVVRSLTVLEGIALSSDPNYKVLGSSYPWIAKKVLTDTSPQLQGTLKSLLYKDGRFRFDRLESLLSESTRPMFGTTAVSTVEEVEAEKRRTLKKVLHFSLSDEGAFVRDILVEEVTKGIDALNRAAVESAGIALADSIPFTIPRPVMLLDDEDRIHLSNLKRLGAIISEGSLEAGEDFEDEEGPALTWQDLVMMAQRTSGLLPTVSSLSVITELPIHEQQQALSIPFNIVGKLASRSLARTIRGLAPKTSSIPLLENLSS